MDEYRIDPEPEPELEPTTPPMAPPTEPAPPLDPGAPTVDEHGRLASNAKCLGCGYNLRGLPHDGECPECHMSIELTFCGNLHLADKEWLSRVSRGLLTLIITIFAGIGVGLTVGITAMITATSSTTGSAQALLVGIPLVLVIGVAICAAWAYVMITTPEPNAPDINRATRLRPVARWVLPGAILLGIVSTATSTEFMSLFNPKAYQSYQPQPISGAFALAGGLFRIVGLYALCTYATTIAVRIPSPSVARQTKVVMWGLIVVGAFSAFWGSAIVFTGSVPTFVAMSPMMLTVFAIAGLAGLAGLVFGIWGIVLLFRYRNSLQRALAQAR